MRNESESAERQTTSEGERDNSTSEREEARDS